MTENTCWDSFRREGLDIAAQVTALVDSGHAKRLRVKHDGRILAEFPPATGGVERRAHSTGRGIAAPITYRGGPLPPLPALAAGGGEVFLEVSVDAEGHVAAVTPLRTPTPFDPGRTAA